MLGFDLDDDVNFIVGTVTCEPPNNQLHKFTGNLNWKNDTYPIDNEKILLRGCTLRNTQWCFGLVIFAGPETKLMQNTGERGRTLREKRQFLLNPRFCKTA